MRQKTTASSMNVMRMWKMVLRLQGYSRGVLLLTELDAYVDASFAGDVHTRRSTTGYVFQWRCLALNLSIWQRRKKLCGLTNYYTSLAFKLHHQLQYIKIIRQRFYLLIILVITAGVSILIPENIMCVMLYSTVMCNLCMYRLRVR